jgi:hypothetical protein
LTPEEFVVTFDLPEGSYMEFAYDENGIMDGSVLAYDSEGNILLSFNVPWAKDAKGKTVETYFTIEGTSIIQTVKHKNQEVDYPIVADPTYISDYFISSGWRYVSNKGYALDMVPYAFLRGGSVANRTASYNKLYQTYSGSKWPSNDSMKHQYICHYEWAPNEYEWNIENWRPDVGYASTVLNACNP